MDASKLIDNNNQTQSIADYLAQLLKDRNKVNAFPNVFIHVERLIDEGKCNFLFVRIFFFFYKNQLIIWLYIFQM